MIFGNFCILYKNTKAMITEDRINANFLSYIKYLEKYGCYSEDMMKELGDKIKYAPYSKNTEYGAAEPGGLVDTTLNVLCRIGAEINTNALGANGGQSIRHPYLCVNQEMLMRVLLLINISKCVMFEEGDTWHKNHGMPYEFVDNTTKLKIGERSLYLCQKYGIALGEEEFEAFLAIDQDETKGERFQTPLYTAVRAALMFTLVELRHRQMELTPNKKETMEK